MTNKHRHAGIPRWIALPAACAVLFLLVPFIALLIRIDWVQFPHLFTQALASQALALSLRTCLASTLACIIVGLPLALVCARARDTWWSRVLRSMVTLPMVLPPVVAGLALLITWGRRGLIGAYLQIFGINIAFTTVAVIMAQTFVSLPFFVSSLEGALRTRGFHEERVASTLGASPSRTLWSVTLPLMIPALVSSTALAFSRALGEFGATITFAGSLAGVTRTLPLEIYLQREESTDMALMLSVILVFVALVLVGGASAFSQRRPAQVSGGQAQRTALARALVVAPDVLLLDEPMAALDVEAARGLRELIAQRFLGRTVIMVTHQIEDAAALDAHIIVLKGGRLLREGPWRELINQSISRADESDSALLAMGLSALERALGQE